ncbi:hypothetical protein E2C01_011363 [Portunus trituberculatus]|uniref:Uncharacterized protein n=1 Tax=Portunus trituberculatus TaxID=210409 RepID=A0A5B7DB39_PORTR|nr:hypothetical protein [Portunus trituberculatus]
MQDFTASRCTLTTMSRCPLIFPRSAKTGEGRGRGDGRGKGEGPGERAPRCLDLPVVEEGGGEGGDKARKTSALVRVVCNLLPQFHPLWLSLLVVVVVRRLSPRLLCPRRKKWLVAFTLEIVWQVCSCRVRSQESGVTVAWFITTRHVYIPSVTTTTTTTTSALKRLDVAGTSPLALLSFPNTTHVLLLRVHLHLHLWFPSCRPSREAFLLSSPPFTTFTPPIKPRTVPQSLPSPQAVRGASEFPLIKVCFPFPRLPRTSHSRV